MKPEDRAAINARNTQPARPITIGPAPRALSLAEERAQNRAATEADEYRTEAHVRTRRPLSTAHEIF